MGVVFDYVGQVVLLTEDELPADVIDEWEATLKGEQARIYNALTTKIPNATVFQDKIADASSDAWENFVSSDWPDADIIKMKQRVKLARAYGAWKDGVDAAFAEGGYFPDRVTGKKDKFKLARYTISIVGLRHDPNIRWRPGYKAVAFFTGDKRVLRYMDPSYDTYTGEPVMAILDAFGRYWRPLVIGQLVRGYVLAMFAHEAGLGSQRDSILSTINSNLDTILTKTLKADYAAPPTSYLHLEYSTSEDAWKVKAHLETAT